MNLRKKLILILAFFAITLLVGGGVYLWVHRVDLIYIPRAWNDVVRANEKKLDVTEALKKFLKVSQLDSDIYEFSSLQSLKTREGEKVWLLCYDPEEAETIIFSSFADNFWKSDCRQHLLVKDDGKIIDLKIPIFKQHYDGVKHEIVKGEIYDLIHVKERRKYGMPVYKLSVDQDGFVPHGYLGFHSDKHFFSWSPAAHDKTNLETDLVADFLSGSKSADYLRALNLIELSGKDHSPARILYKCEDLLVRKKALTVLGHHDPNIENLRPFISDPNPELRWTILYELLKRNGWEKELLLLSKDPLPEIREVAHWYLTKSKDSKFSHASTLYLLKNRSKFCVKQEYQGLFFGIDFSNNNSVEILDELLNFVEGSTGSEVEDFSIDYDSQKLILNLGHFKKEQLEVYKSRLVSLYQRIMLAARDEKPWFLGELLVPLIVLEDKEVDELITPSVKLLVQGESLPTKIIFWELEPALFSRVKPIQPLIDSLWETDKRWENEIDPDFYWNWGPASPHLWLLAKWNIASSRELLAKRIRKRVYIDSDDSEESTTSDFEVDEPYGLTKTEYKGLNDFLISNKIRIQKEKWAEIEE